MVQGYVVFSLVPVIGMNSGGPLNLVLNVAFLLALFFVLRRWARPGFAAEDARSIVVFGSWGFFGLCLYLGLLYGVTYPFMLPQGLPSAAVQAFTFVFYAMAILGLWCYRRRVVSPVDAAVVEPREWKLVMVLFGLMLGLGLLFSLLAGQPILFVPILGNFAIWAFLGFALTMLALAAGVRERRRMSSAG